MVNLVYKQPITKAMNWIQIMGRVKEHQQELDEQAIEEAALRAANNMGAARDIFIPDVGWIMRDGKPTDVGLAWYKENQDKFQKD